MTLPLFRIREIALFERPVWLRLPFRFGVVTLREAPQAFARLVIETAEGRLATGMAAELMVPKWFDKNPALSNEQNFAQLRRSLGHALEAYQDGGLRSAFGHSAAHHANLLAAGAAAGLNPLVASYGPALLDRAVIDALCRLLGTSFGAALRSNLYGIEAGVLTPDLAGFDIAAFLAQLSPCRRIAARHTVGMLDPLAEADLQPGERLNDGLPESLEGVIAAYGLRWFKLKVGGDMAQDLARLKAIAAVLDQGAAPYRASLDGNEQYDDEEGIAGLWRAMRAEPALRRLCASIQYIEQPIKRASALERPVTALAAEIALIVDESDADYGVFPQARSLGYAGISSKTCKGVYRAILNAARAKHWGEGCFITGEDLTCQAGLAVQQDLALVAMLGLYHVERNGHHYVDGFGAAPAAEQAGFAAAHADLYDNSSGRPRLRIAAGDIALGSLLDATGFASAAAPDWASLAPMDLNEPNQGNVA
ncbi:enolase C-terminal domain-like protein [Ferrovibrio sp.]|uniref:enolase C-terminal domain-like protein n=1 Tax=Ferrovibrio sp. TaxID=1917215 RepID=UPI001B3F5993|nr:enolase C-terminal domain-like protein [Ferrovibrio sp.]MBP7063382.1 mandelate racemase [Ferrovibrio sp.]